MILDEKLRWAGFWILDGLRGGQTRKYYDRIRYAWKEGSSVAETEERIRNLIRHAVKTTDFYKDYPEDTPLEKLPVVNKDTFRQHYDSFLSSTYKDAEDNRVMCTSGSTGTPLRMIQNKDKICHNTAGGIFLGAAAGYYIGMKEAFIRVWVNNVRKSKLRLFQENLIMMDSSRMDDKALAGMLDVIEKKKVKCLVGYSSALGELSEYIRKTGRDCSKFRVRAIKRAGLLHDIGKSIDHEVEGSHIQIGVDLCKKYKESAVVINTVASHHGDVEPESLVACIVQAADAISAARPGARRETLETYTNRLKQLEDITNEFKGVDKSFAIQAGREIRVMVIPEQVNDADMVLLARDISKQIEAELEYPGQIKVNVIRESRAVDYAK